MSGFPKGPMTLRRASVAGLLYALVMCAWVYYDRGLGFDQMALRFAIYFTVFTTGFWILYNLFSHWTKNRDEP